jgi:ankyrin repeat protein
VELLVENGAYIDLADENGLTPLHYALDEENVVLLDKLISLGADVYIEDYDGQSVYEQAMKHENSEIINLVSELG